MYRYSDKEHSLWVEEVKRIYEEIKSHKDPYFIDFLGIKLEVLPNVFSPKYFNNTKWYAEILPKIVGKKSLLEIGTGTGAIALNCSLNSASVTATDINKEACTCARSNFQSNDCKIPVYHGDVFDPIPNNQRFDYIFWNHPYNNSAEVINDELIIAGFDYNYNKLRKYITEASHYLKDQRRGLLLGTGGQADTESIEKIALESGYQIEIIEIIKMPLGKNTLAPNDFRICALNK